MKAPVKTTQGNYAGKAGSLESLWASCFSSISSRLKVHGKGLPHRSESDIFPRRSVPLGYRHIPVPAPCPLEVVSEGQQPGTQVSYLILYHRVFSLPLGPSGGPGQREANA